MNFVACILMISFQGDVKPVAVTGALLAETEKYYMVDFGNAAYVLTHSVEAYRSVRVDKNDCIKK